LLARCALFACLLLHSGTPLGALRALRLRPFGFLRALDVIAALAATAAFGLRRSRNGDRRNGGNQKSFSHRSNPGDGCQWQSRNIEKSA
jgi:hypothetical protein